MLVHVLQCTKKCKEYLNVCIESEYPVAANRVLVTSVFMLLFVVLMFDYRMNIDLLSIPHKNVPTDNV